MSKFKSNTAYASQRIDLAKILKPVLRKNEPVPAAAIPRAPAHDDGSPITQEIADRLHREEVTASIAKVLASGGQRVTPKGWV
jgi:predicted regulator of Ras-like GTPase activity (Roadblock/LC7/MglB family)